MAVNKYLPHVFVLPEDDANRQMANGFVKDSSINSRKIQILTEAGGWLSVLEQFVCDHVPELKRWPDRFMVLLIDFDHDDHRLDKVKEKIPSHLTDRVFALGAFGEPEGLKAALGGSLEDIGGALARACRDSVDGAWTHKLLQHNAGELQRLRQAVRPILFS